jgi:hypothetical protein
MNKGNAMNPQLEMLTAREQLMEDIDLIVDNHLNEKLTPQEQLRLVIDLCDAVCHNFPTEGV